MPIFAFYDFRIGQRKDDEVDMFKVQEEDNQPPKHYDSPEACFGSFFKTGGKLSLNVLREKGKGKEKTVEWEPFENDVLMVADNVILMTIENNKVKHTTNKTLQMIDNYTNDIRYGRKDFNGFTLPEHAGLCKGGSPLIGAAIVVSYARRSLTTGCNVERSQGQSKSSAEISSLDMH